MEDMKVTAIGYDFRPAHAAMQRYVDGTLIETDKMEAILTDIDADRADGGWCGLV